MQEEKVNMITLSRSPSNENSQIFSLNKLSRRELNNMQIRKNNEKPISLSKHDSFSSTTNLAWRKIYPLPRKTTINTKLSVFQ